MTFAEFQERAHRAFLLHVLAAHDWCVTRAARELRMERPNLYKLLRRYQITRPVGTSMRPKQKNRP